MFDEEPLKPGEYLDVFLRENAKFIGEHDTGYIFEWDNWIYYDSGTIKIKVPKKGTRDETAFGGRAFFFFGKQAPIDWFMPSEEDMDGVMSFLNSYFTGSSLKDLSEQQYSHNRRSFYEKVVNEIKKWW